MLGNLLGKRIAKKRAPDKIWRSRDLEFRGLLTFIASLDPTATRVLLVAHFSDTLRLLEQQLGAQNLNFRTYSTVFEGYRLHTLSEYQDPGCILLAHAHVLPERSSAPDRPAAPSSIGIYVLIAEHHPISHFDDHILEFAQGLPCLSHIGFHESLDGAFLRHYGGMDMVQLTTALQIPDDECISHSMIDKSIRHAQEKIGRQVTNPMTADSSEQWFQQNLPSRK